MLPILGILYDKGLFPETGWVSSTSGQLDKTCDSLGGHFWSMLSWARISNTTKVVSETSWSAVNVSNVRLTDGGGEGNEKRQTKKRLNQQKHKNTCCLSTWTKMGKFFFLADLSLGKLLKAEFLTEDFCAAVLFQCLEFILVVFGVHPCTASPCFSGFLQRAHERFFRYIEI